MSKRILGRQAILALLRAGKTPTEVIGSLGVSRQTVYSVKKRMETTPDGQEVNLEVKYRPRARKVMTPRVQAAVRRRIRTAPTKSLRRVAKEAKVGREAVRKVVLDEGWRSRRRVKVPLVSAEGRERRALRALGLINALKTVRKGTIIFFSDEKNFVIDPVFNPQNDRWIQFNEANSDNPDDTGGARNAADAASGKYLSLIHI